jgi:hypothetical protein
MTPSTKEETNECQVRIYFKDTKRYHTQLNIIGCKIVYTDHILVLLGRGKPVTIFNRDEVSSFEIYQVDRTDGLEK